MGEEWWKIPSPSFTFLVALLVGLLGGKLFTSLTAATISIPLSVSTNIHGLVFKTVILFVYGALFVFLFGGHEKEEIYLFIRNLKPTILHGAILGIVPIIVPVIIGLL
ncbi:MAG: hypothetical protein ACE5K4_07735 [Candidatus Hydrothermarchaeota archaeon]